MCVYVSAYVSVCLCLHLCDLVSRLYIRRENLDLSPHSDAYQYRVMRCSLDCILHILCVFKHLLCSSHPHWQLLHIQIFPQTRNNEAISKHSATQEHLRPGTEPLHLLKDSNLRKWKHLCVGKNDERKADSTLRSSQAVLHTSIDRAPHCLTSEVKRDPVHSTRYGRRRSLWFVRHPNRFGNASIPAVIFDFWKTIGRQDSMLFLSIGYFNKYVYVVMI